MEALVRFLIDLLRYYDLHPQIDFDRIQRAMRTASIFSSSLSDDF